MAFTEPVEYPPPAPPPNARELLVTALSASRPAACLEEAHRALGIASPSPNRIDTVTARGLFHALAELETVSARTLGAILDAAGIEANQAMLSLPEEEWM